MPLWKLFHDRAEGEGVNLTLVITPMLDMSFQLLAFFIMTYHPSALEAHIDGRLMPPEKVARAAAPQGNKDKEPPKEKEKDKKKDEIPSDKEPDVKETARVSIRRDAPQGKEGPDQPFSLNVQLRKPGSTQAEPVFSVEYAGARKGNKNLNPEEQFQEGLEPENLTKPRAGSAYAQFKAGLKKLKDDLTTIRNGPDGGKISLTLDADPNLPYGYFIVIQDTCKSAKFDNIGFAAPAAAQQGQ